MPRKTRYSWQDKRVWLIGGSTGIGAELARLLAARGASVAVSARSEDGLRKLLAKEPALRAFALDVTEEGACARVADDIRAEMGGIDALIYSAGAWTASHTPGFDLDAMERQTAVNYTGLVRAIAAVLPAMTERRDGLIAGLSSASSYLPLPTAEAYGASKAAVNYFLRSLRLDTRKSGVRVVNISPGFVRTPLTDKNRFRMPFMVDASDAARTIANGIERGETEIDFPKRLTLPLRLLGTLPVGLQQWLVSLRLR